MNSEKICEWTAWTREETEIFHHNRNNDICFEYEHRTCAEKRFLSLAA